MATNETDIIVDKASETAFSFLDELNDTNELNDSDLKIALSSEHGYSEYLTERIFDAWQDYRNRKMLKGLKKPHPAHRNRIKVLETFIKEIL
jgi:hypothetical protein